MGKYYKGPDPDEVARQINEEFYAEQRMQEIQRRKEELLKQSATAVGEENKPAAQPAENAVDYAMDNGVDEPGYDDFGAPIQSVQQEPEPKVSKPKLVLLTGWQIAYDFVSMVLAMILIVAAIPLPFRLVYRFASYNAEMIKGIGAIIEAGTFVILIIIYWGLSWPCALLGCLLLASFFRNCSDTFDEYVGPMVDIPSTIIYEVCLAIWGLICKRYDMIKNNELQRIEQDKKKTP
jgi:hypothetical protein